MDTTLADEIERSFGDGPTPPAPAAYVVSGRAALRRRRLAAGAATVAACLVLGGVGWASLPGGATTDAGQVATDPSPAPEETPSPTTEVSPLVESDTEVRAARTDDEMMMLGREGLAVAPLGDGTLVRRPGWTVERLVVLEDLARHQAWGVELSRDADAAGQWALASWSGDGSTSVSFEEPGKRFAVFDDWIRDRWAQEQRWSASSGGGAGATSGAKAPLVAQVVDGEVVADDGVVLLEVVMGPAETEAYGPVEEQAAVRLRLADGAVMFGRVDAYGTTTVDPAVLEAPTMAAFLRHLSAQADSGEGLR